MFNVIQKYFKRSGFFGNEDMHWKSYLIFEKISVLFGNLILNDYF